jgi:prolyl oligopeptidase
MTTPNYSADDPFIWLEEVEGERALDWVRAQNARSLAQLEADPRYGELHGEALAIANSQDRLALGQVRGAFLYNFWQDETHVRGIWRRSPLAEYARGAPVWDTLLDIDALAAAENANWVFKGVDCLEDSPRCMVSLSDGGKDATTWREFDVEARAFVEGGFATPEAKTGITWLDENTLYVSTDWGPGSLTESGYPFIIKRWTRGTHLAAADEILRGQVEDVGVFTGELTDTDGAQVFLAYEANTFFTTTYWRLDPVVAPARGPKPEKATPHALPKGPLIITN